MISDLLPPLWTQVHHKGEKLAITCSRNVATMILMGKKFVSLGLV